MAPNSKENTLKSQQERLIEKTLRAGGFTFPETVEEVREFERIFGTTDITMPDELNDTSFLYNSNKNSAKKALVAPISVFAAAARGASSHLSEAVKKQMESDRRKADALSNIKKNGAE